VQVQTQTEPLLQRGPQHHRGWSVRSNKAFERTSLLASRFALGQRAAQLARYTCESETVA
jgi:hypothetical protein